MLPTPENRVRLAIDVRIKSVHVKDIRIKYITGVLILKADTFFVIDIKTISIYSASIMFT